MTFCRAAGCAVAVTPDAKGMYPEEEEGAEFIGKCLFGLPRYECTDR